MVEKLNSYSASAAERESKIKALQQEEARQRQLKEEEAHRQQLKEEQEKAKQKELQEQQLEKYVLGEYKGKKLFYPSWTATRDYLSCKGKNLYYKGLKEFSIQNLPEPQYNLPGYVRIIGEGRAGFPSIKFGIQDARRVIALVEYVNNRIKELNQDSE